MSRLAILEATRRVLRDRSFADLALEDVAAAAGVARRTIYNQFLGKDDLYRASRESLLADIGAEMPIRIDPALPVGAGLRSFAARMVEILASEEHHDFAMSLLRDRPAQGWLLSAYTRQVAEPVHRILEIYLYGKRDRGEFDCADVSEAAGLFLQLMQSTAGAMRLMQPLNDTRHVPGLRSIDAIVRAFLFQHGLGGEPTQMVA